MALYSDTNLYVNVLNTEPLVYDEHSINQSIMTILGTVPGQRIFRPNFGSNIWYLLFEPMNEDTASSIRNATIVAIERWEVRVVLSQALVIPNYDMLVYYVDITYTIPTLANKVANFAFNLSKLPN